MQTHDSWKQKTSRIRKTSSHSLWHLARLLDSSFFLSMRCGSADRFCLQVMSREYHKDEDALPLQKKQSQVSYISFGNQKFKPAASNLFFFCSTGTIAIDDAHYAFHYAAYFEVLRLWKHPSALRSSFVCMVMRLNVKKVQAVHILTCQLETKNFRDHECHFIRIVCSHAPLANKIWSLCNLEIVWSSF